MQGSDKSAAPFLDLIDAAQKTPDYTRWDDRCQIIRKRYRYDNSKNVKVRKYQLLWSNIQIMKPAIYTKPPVCVVQRRYRDGDPVGKKAVTLLERAIRFQSDLNNYDDTFNGNALDFLLYGRGVARVTYEPVTLTVEDEDDTDGLDDEAMRGPQYEANEEKKEAAEVGDPQEVLDFENVHVRFIQREDFVHQPARTWEECEWVAFRAFLTKEALIERFGEEIAKNIPLDAAPDRPEGSEKSPGASSLTDKATIWEYWDKTKQRVLWIAKGYPTVLEESDPYLKLDGFFPCPKPAMGTCTTDSLIPVPDYVYYQDQAEEIDALTARIAALQQALKLVGFYAAGPQGEGSPEIERAMSPGFENKMIAVKSFAAFAQAGKEGKLVVWLPVEMVATILKDCIELRKQLIEDVYQIIGISDIMRGDAQASETATAQTIKAQFGSVRIRERQQEIARFSRDVLRMVGEIIAQQFQPETLLKMANMKLPTQQDVMMAQQQQALQYQQAVQQARMQAPQQPMQPGMPPQAPQVPPPPQPVDLGPTVEDVMGLLRDEMLRRFRVDIEADSTIVGDESQERKDRTDFLTMTTQFMKEWAPLIAENKLLTKMGGDFLLFGVRAFRVGRELEETIEETVEKLEQQAGQPPPPDPRAQAEQVKLQSTQVKAQAEQTKAQIGVQQAQVEGQAKVQSALLDHHMAMAGHQMQTDQNAQQAQLAQQDFENKQALMEQQARAAQQQASQAGNA